MSNMGLRLFVGLASTKVSLSYTRLRIIVASTPAKAWVTTVTLLTWLQTLLRGAWKTALEEPIERSSFIARYRAEVPDWRSLVRALPALTGGAWEGVTETMESFEDLFDRICKFSSTTQETKELRGRLFSALGTMIDYSVALESCGSCRQLITRVRSQYTKLIRDQTRQSNTQGKRPSACLENLWTRISISSREKTDERKNEYIVFEARALALRYSVDMQIVAFVTLFGLILGRVSAETRYSHEDLTRLFADVWEDATQTKEARRLRPCFAELAAIRMGLSVRPNRL